jgi:hypothetical protein
MKIQIKDIEFNPFRNMKLVPIDPLTVDALKESIEDKLWVGMTARPKNNDWKSGKYEIPYGHHRLVAIKELGIKELDIPIEEISDFDMVLRMVRENFARRGYSVEIINGTVQNIKEFLDSEIKKWNDYDHVNEIIKVLFKSNSQFIQCKKDGVGQTTVLKFLKGSIPQWQIQSALDLIKHDDIDLGAVNLLKSTGQVEGFKKAIRKINAERKNKGKEPIPKSEHKKLAEITAKSSANGRTGGGDYYKSIEGKIRKEIDDMSADELLWNEIYSELETIKDDTKRLADKIALINGKLDDLGIEEIKTLSSLSLTNNFARLLTNTNVLANTLGIQFTELEKLTA